MGQKKVNKTLYKNDKFWYPTFDFGLFILAIAIGAADPYL